MVAAMCGDMAGDMARDGVRDEFREVGAPGNLRGGYCAVPTGDEVSARQLW